MSKILGLCLATIMDAHLVTSDNQFGFNQKHSTDLCIYTVKSAIQYYNDFNSPVYICFLDAPRAFDRVNHRTMFKNLIKGCANYCSTYVMFLVSFSATLYTMRSSFFTIFNGTRQGVILSPKLFSAYMDDLSNLLICSGIGCFLDKDLLLQTVIKTTTICYDRSECYMHALVDLLDYFILVAEMN